MNENEKIKRILIFISPLKPQPIVDMVIEIGVSIWDCAIFISISKLIN